MGVDSIRIGLESPLTADLALLFARHERDMHADTPPESIHMLPRAALSAPTFAFFVMREAGQAVAMGAIKRLGGMVPPEGEIKSMHVLDEARGRGLSRQLLDWLITYARNAGMVRLNLETGIQPTFAPARALYARAGFTECPPFQGYVDDPNSVFLTLPL